MIIQYILKCVTSPEVSGLATALQNQKGVLNLC